MSCIVYVKNRVFIYKTIGNYLITISSRLNYVKKNHKNLKEWRIIEKSIEIERKIVVDGVRLQLSKLRK